MSRRPRPRGESVLTTGVMVTCGLAGLFVAVANLGLIAIGKNHYGDLATGRSIALVGFSLMLVVAAFEARSETDTAFTVDSFNSSKMNLIALAEVGWGVPHHSGRLHAPPARYRSTHCPAMGDRTARGDRAAAGLGGRQVHRPPTEHREASP